MKYGMNLLLWTANVDESHFGLLSDLKGIGFDGVELPMFELEPDHFKKVGAELSKTGLASTAVTVCTPEENPSSEEAAVRQKGVERLKKAIDCCHAAGATSLCGPIHSALGHFVGRGRTEEEWNWAKESLAEAADYAKQADVMLVFEYLNRFECYFANCAEDAARFTREVGHSNLKMMYDTFHANIEEKSITKAFEACKDQLVHIHISENDRSTPGEGDIKWQETFEAIKSSGYDGWLTIEAFGLALPELAAATMIWRRMFPDELYLARNGYNFMKSQMEG